MGDARMQPPVELSRLTILNLASIICYCLAMLFHIIAFATDDWSSLHLEGVTWRAGLWQGCRQNEGEDTWFCSTEVFNDKVFKSGSDWHVGSRVLMTLSLVLLFFLLFAVIGYTCIKRLERYKSKVVAIVMGLSASSGLFTLSTLCLVGTLAFKFPEGKLEWSFGMVLLSFAFQILCPSIIIFDCYKTRLMGKTMAKSRECISADPVDFESQFCYTNTVVDMNIDDRSF